MNLTLHIEELILDDLPLGADAGDAVRAAVEGELTRLWHTGAWRAEGVMRGAHTEVRLPEITLTQVSSRAVGTQVARGLYGALGNAPLAKGDSSKRA